MDKVRMRCKVCGRRVSILPVVFARGRLARFTCPLCLASGVFRNRDFVPFLFVHSVRVVSRAQYWGVLKYSSKQMLPK